MRILAKLSKIKELTNNDKICELVDQCVDIILDKKTSSQNRYAHKIIQLAATEFGYEYNDFRELMKEMYGARKILELRNGQEKEIIKSISDYSKEEMQSFIDTLIMEWSQMGFEAPEPN